MSDTEDFITEKDFKKRKKRKPLSEAQLLHLENIHKIAMEKKNK